MDEQPVYLREIRKKYKRYVEKFFESRRKPVKESSSSSKSNKSESFPSPCSSCSGTISTPSTPTISPQKSSNLSPKQSARSNDNSKRFVSHEKSAKIGKCKTKIDDGKDKAKDLIKNKTSDNVQKSKEFTHNANGELKSKSNGLSNKVNENSSRAKHQSRHYPSQTTDRNIKMEINADECRSTIKEENLQTIEQPVKGEKKLNRQRLNGNVEQFMDDVRSKSKPIKIPTNVRKTVVELPKSQAKCTPPPPIQTPTKQQKFSSFDAALSESSTVIQPYKKPSKPSAAQPSTELVTKAPEIKSEQKQEHPIKPPKEPPSATEKKRNYMNVNGIQIELPDGVENNSVWFKCVVRLNRLKRKSNAIDMDDSTPSAPKRLKKRKELETFGILTIDLNSSAEAIENVATSIESTSCFTPKSILLDSNRQQTPSTKRKRVSFYGAGDCSDDETNKPKKRFAKEKRPIEKKIVREKPSDANVNNDESIILLNNQIVLSLELRSPKKLSMKNDGIQPTEEKSEKTDKNSSQSNLAVNSFRNEISDKSDVCVVVPSEIINECSSSNVEPIRKKKRKTKADNLTINESTEKYLKDDNDNGVGASKSIDESNITVTDTQINSEMSIEMNPSQQINLTDTKCNQTRNEDVINDCYAIKSVRAPNDKKRKMPKQKRIQKQKQKLEQKLKLKHRGPRKLQKQSLIEHSMTNLIVKQNQFTDMTADIGYCAIIPTIENKPKKVRKKKKLIAAMKDEKTTTKRNEIQSNVVSVDMNKIIKAANESAIESPVVQSHELTNKFDEEVTFVSDMDPLALETISPSVVENPFKMPEISAPVVESFDSVTLKMRICNGRVINAGKTPPQNMSPNKATKAGAMHRSPRTKKKKGDTDFIESDEPSPAEESANEMVTEKKKFKLYSMPKRHKIEQNESHAYPAQIVAKKNLRGQFGDRIFDAYVKLNRNPNIDQALYGDGSVVVRFETPNVGLSPGMQYINQTVDSPQISNDAQIVSNDCDTSYTNADVTMESAIEKATSEHITESVENMENCAIIENHENHEIYEPDSVTTIQTDEYSLNIIQEPFISVGNSCIESPMIPILSEIEPNGIGFESPTATVDSTTSGYSSATTASTICSLELVPAQFHIGTNEVPIAISINNYVTNNINSSNYDDDESSGIYFSNLNMANCVGIGSSLEQINADDIISVLGKPMDSHELSMDDGISMGAFDTTSQTNHVVSRNYYLNDYNPLNAFNSGHSISTPNGIVFRTKAALKQIDIPGLGSMNDNYCNDLSSTANELSTKLLRNDNPLLNHHSSGSVDETAIEIREASSSFSTVTDSMVTSSETTAVSPLPSIRRSGLNITISTPTKGTAHGADLHHGDMLFDIFEENQRQLLNAEIPTTTTPLIEPPFDLNSYNY